MRFLSRLLPSSRVPGDLDERLNRGHVPPRYPAMPAATPPAMPQIRPALLKIADARKAIERAEEAWNLTQLEDAVRSAEYFIAEARKQMAIPHIPMPKP